MSAKWYRGYRVKGYRDDYINRVSIVVRQNDWGKVISRLHFEKRVQKGEFYLFLGFNTERKGQVPPHISRILDSINIGNFAGDFEHAEIKPMISVGIDIEHYRRTVMYRPLAFTFAEDPFDLSDLEIFLEQQGSKSPLSVNRLLYWLSAVGMGGWPTFKKVCDLLTTESVGLDARHIFRRLRLLGHVEYAARNGSRWSVCPPALVQTSQPEIYFLAGQRTPRLLSSLANVAEVEEQPQPTGEAPDLVEIRFASTEAARQAISSGQFGLRWAGCVSMRLAQVLPDLAGYQASLSPVSGFALSNFKLEQWQGQAYVETHFEQQTGLYRLTPHDDNVRLSPQSLFFDAVTNQWRTGAWYDLRYLAQQAAGESCRVQYHRGQQRLAIPANYRWPDLYERALVLASGLLPLPSPDSHWFYFSDISPDLTQILTTKLNATLEEIA